MVHAWELQQPKIEGPFLFLGVQSWVVPNSPNFRCIPGTNSAQKPYAFFPFLERKRKEREKLYWPRVNYIIISNQVVYITALKTLKERGKKIIQYNYLVKWGQLQWMQWMKQTLNGGSKQSKRLVFVRKIHTLHPGGRGFVRIPQGDLMRFEWAFGQIPQGSQGWPPGGSRWLMHYYCKKLGTGQCTT